MIHGAGLTSTFFICGNCTKVMEEVCKVGTHGFAVDEESLPADIGPAQLAALQRVATENLMTDPKDFLTEVRVPVLAFFGEDDLNVDSRTSPGLFEQYLTQAGNEDYTIVVIPDVGHDVGLSTPGYWDALSKWLSRLYSD